MSDIDDIQKSIDELAQARKEKERKLKEAVKVTRNHRRKQREQSRRPE